MMMRSRTRRKGERGVTYDGRLRPVSRSEEGPAGVCQKMGQPEKETASEAGDCVAQYDSKGGRWDQ